MRRFYRYPSTFLLFACLTANLQAQPVVQSGEVPVAFDASQARFEHLTVADGLPSNNAVALLQDHLGFIWIGTGDGLARYDGLTMTAFQDDPDDPYSFRGTGVSVLLEDRAGDLWIGTGNTGLIHYDRATGRFTTYANDPEDTASLSNNAVSYLHEDQRGDLWVVTDIEVFNSNIDRFNRATGTFTRFRHDPSDPGSLSSDHVTRNRFFTFSTFAFYEDRSGTIWVGTPGGGLNRFDAVTETFKHYQHDADNPASLSHNYIRSITEDRTGQFWITTAGGGLNRFDPGTETFTPYRHDPDDPLSVGSDTLVAAYEDQHGALWVTFVGGLDRLDLDTGTFTHFPQDDHQTGSPRHYRLLPVHEDEAGLWFLSDHIRPPVFETGLHYYDRATGTFTLLVNDPEDPGSLSEIVLSFLKDRSGTVWVGSGEEGVNKLDDRPRFPRYTHDPANPNSPSSNSIRVLYEAPSEPGVLWIGTDEGLDRWDRATGHYTHYRHDPRDPHSLGVVYRGRPGRKNREAFVSDLLEDRAGRFWVTTASGLHLMDRETGRFTRINQDNGDTPSTMRLVLAEAPDGALWIGISPGGLLHFDPETQLLKRYSATADTSYHEDFYRALAESETDGRRIAALLQVGDAADLTQPFSLDEPAQVMIVAMGEKGSPFWDYGWIEDETGALVWEMSPVDNRHAGGWPINRIQGALMHLEAGRYRLRYRSDGAHSDGGGWEFIPPEHPEHWGIEVLRVTAAEADTLAALLQKRDQSRISSDRVSVLHTDREGLLWIGTRGGGLNRYDPTTETFTTFMDPRSGPLSVSALHEDRAGRLWMGDSEKGLHLIDRERGSVRRYGKYNGLPSNGVRSILEDDEGLLWLNTQEGLVRFDPEAETLTDGNLRFPGGNLRFRTYGASYDLQDVSNGFKSADGTLFYGGDSVTAVYPNRLADDPIPPEVALTGFDLFNAPAAIGTDSPLQADVSVAEQITLAHDENDFTFHFAALHFSRPEENTVAYRLEPYETNWVAGGPARSARYTNLSPGTYTFRVKAANADGVWNEEGASIRITIAPPWWRTWWAYGFYGVLLLGGIFAVDRMQRKRLLRQERERTQARELEQARAIEQAYTQLKATQAQLIQSEKMASLGALTAGIAHEIKNPLNFVNNFAEVNEELADELREQLDASTGKAVDEVRADLDMILADLKQNAQVIAQHGKRADGIVHAMMQHASGGTGQRAATDLNALVSEHIDLAYHGKRAQVPGLTVEISRDLDADAGTIEIVPQEIGRVLLNLLSNAFDAVHEHALGVKGAYAPTVTVATRRIEGRVEIRVKDNGPGTPEEIREKIFEPFFTTKPTGSGTGLGLSLSYDIITQGHGGTLTVESDEGKGATFIIRLPCS